MKQGLLHKNIVYNIKYLKNFKVLENLNSLNFPIMPIESCI